MRHREFSCSVLFMSATATAVKVFRVLGTTDDVTVCGLCGREELKGTVVLESADGDVYYYGSSCGAKAAGWTTKDIVKAAKDADAAKREEEHKARVAAIRAKEALYAEHLIVTAGTADLWKASEARGFDGVFPMRKADRAAGVAGA